MILIIAFNILSVYSQGKGKMQTYWLIGEKGKTQQ